MERVRELWLKDPILLAKRTKDTTIDGLKRSYEDNSWLIIRASGTEPLIRVYADAPSLARAEELVRDGEAVVQQALKD